ncbi:hypothetical protein C8F01DRAFT_1255921 [Mycena amicta]|nr:hypothetical protein C8F01DRAFT_1255921 [Mycena amicta]
MFAIHLNDSRGSKVNPATTRHAVIILLQLGKENEAELAQPLIGCLLTNFGALVVQPPENGGDDLAKVRLHSDTEGVDDGPKAVEYDLVLRGLLLKRVDDAVHQSYLQTLVDIRSAELNGSTIDSGTRIRERRGTYGKDWR